MAINDEGIENTLRGDDRAIYDTLYNEPLKRVYQHKADRAFSDMLYGKMDEMKKNAFSKVSYDAQGNAYLQDRGAAGEAWGKLLGQAGKFEDYANMIKGGMNNPFLAQGAAQNQAMYAGMGLLGTPAAASAQNQYLMDYQLQQQAMLPQLYAQQASVYGQAMQGAMGIDQYASDIYKTELNTMMQKYGIDKGFQGQMQGIFEQNAQRQRELDAQPGFWENMLMAGVGAAGKGAGYALGAGAVGGGAGAAGAGGAGASTYTPGMMV